jgi:translocation and assembly module TamB
MRRKRWLAAGIAVAAAVSTGAALFLVLQSHWLSEIVRAHIVKAVESATGGRAELGQFQFEWKQLRARIRNFTLHGKEPADEPPLFHATEIAIGLKVVSALTRHVDIDSLEVVNPRIDLLIAPDGSTNLPEPGTKRTGSRPLETLVNLAIAHFKVTNGILEIQNRGKTPFAAQGQNLNARLSYEAAASRYRGELSMQPLQLGWPSHPPLAAAVRLWISIERNRIAVDSAAVVAGDSRLALSGAIENLAAPTAKFHYEARIALSQAAPLLSLKGLTRGMLQTSGEAVWTGRDRFNAAGKLQIASLEYLDSSIRLRDCMLSGTYQATPAGAVVSNVRFGGSFLGPVNRLPASGSVASATLRGRELELRGIVLRTLNGEFRGQAAIHNFNRFALEGRVDGLEARRAVEIYSRETIPWNAFLSGDVRTHGSFLRRKDFELQTHWIISPAPGEPPVSGRFSIAYNARSGILDVGRSSIELPASRIDFAGILGQTMRIRFQTRDLNDLLPALGQRPMSVPVAIASGGGIRFEGSVQGKLDQPQVVGRLTANGLRVFGRDLDSLRGLIQASSGNLRIDHATASVKSVQLGLNAAVALSDWKAQEGSLIYGTASLSGAKVQDVLELAGVPPETASGRLSGSAQFSGTLGNPLVSAGFEVVRGDLRGEPFDRLTGHLNSSNNVIALTSGMIAAGTNTIQLTAAFHHPFQRFDSGRVHVEIASNPMAIEQIVHIAQARPGLRGALQIKASADVDITSGPGGARFRLASIDSEVTGENLELDRQPLGRARLATRSQGQRMKASIIAELSKSQVRGEGEWELAGDYPGSATITIASFDFGQLRPWLPPSFASQFGGAADGEIRIQGPALKPDALKAELRLSKLSILSATKSGFPSSMALNNSGPIVITLANSVATIQSARMRGSATDLSLNGAVRLNQKNPLDLRLAGRLDLRMLHEIDHNLEASGFVSTDASIRGELAKPQINGRMEFQDAAFNVVDVPNGISRANGLILFTGDRATIQRFTGETGGGKIDLNGFASYAGGSLVFHIRAAAKEVRVRYPEGVSTVADADLRLTGTSDRSNLSGTITILRTGFNVKSDFSSLIAQSAEPVQTPSARTGLLGGLNFDIQIHTSPDIQFESSLTQDLQVEANLRLRGTVSNPALIGRINLTHGQVIFYGSRFNVSQGSISFYNPLKVEPILDVDLETRARGIDITLTVSGPLNKLNLTPRSDPPLQFSEIVALLATGRTPTSDPTLLNQQATAPNAWQQTGASALLGQAIASPVAGRLQRFFGVSKLRIDPTLPGVENNPQARLTLEQQVTPDITFTYITNVTSSNPLVVRVEWAVSKQWSAVALREENGVFGLDFYYRKQF